ncbi:branched-chain amino acid ABC transporter permease [Streptosporangium sandarakinum]|uniref:branched-chain amino acid ABC transporter permease n=1 Tax=Streptosporangium sandarakinum TaxID=1260955 RepID=UPI00343C973F
MTLFLQQLLVGLTNGAIYASLALALAIIYRTTGVVNLAQGEIAMFSAFIAWQLNHWGLHIWLAVLLSVVLSFCLGTVIERVALRPIQGGPTLPVVIVTIGLMLVMNQLAGWIWQFNVKDFPSLFPAGNIHLGAVQLPKETLGMLAVLVVAMVAVFQFFQRTKLGLAMRAAANSQDSARLVGIPVNRMLMLGWGLAAALGALVGPMVASQVFLEPNMMSGIMIYSFAAAVLGSLDSAAGAVVGGMIVGISEVLGSTYLPFVGGDLKILVPFVIIVGVLLVKPTGLFGRKGVVRV